MGSIHSFKSGGDGFRARAHGHVAAELLHRRFPTPGSQVVVTGEDSTTPKTSIRGRGVVGAGAKFYVTPRVFVRTDGRFAIGTSGRHLLLRAGVGVDF